MYALPPLAIASYALLALAVVCVWIGRPLWMAALVSAVVAGYASILLEPIALFWIGAFAFACWLYRRPDFFGRFVGALSIATLGVQLGVHALPGFHNAPILLNETLSAGAAPYDLYLNFDKTLVGMLFLGLAYPALIHSRRELTQALRSGAPWIAVTVLMLMLTSLALGYVRWAPKMHELFWLWAGANLLSTCVSEEAFFRAFVQGGLQQAFNRVRFGERLALITAAVLFGLAHAAGGWTYVLLATVAGLGYGYVFQRTGRIEMAILTHFAVNAVHFLLFTYPRIA